MTPFIGLCMHWAPDFAPRNWAYCANQLIAISQNTALFSLIGTTYGGNGIQTFALPDLRGRAGLAAGSSTTGTRYVEGEVAGTDQTTLLTTNMPAHTHAVSPVTGTLPATATQADTNGPATGLAFGMAHTIFDNGGSEISAPVNAYAAGPADVTSAAGASGGTVTFGVTGHTAQTPITQPYLGLNIIIAMYGIFPPRS
ncbi:phage tail protein [Tistrella mobilis]|uniref:phage tail protein n=1 Tax=Tistrella mobilis TaxID=171437 RepID=UPI003558A6EE